MNTRALFNKYIKDHDTGKAHAVLSASGASRWMGCPGSVRMSEGITPETSEWSKAGTNAHTLFQFALENGVGWECLLSLPEAKKFKAHIELSEDQLLSVRYAAQYVQDAAEKMRVQYDHDPQMFVEKKVEFPGIGFGTADVILYQPFGTLHVMDYKSGRGIVEPEENKQGLYYAIATAEEMGWDFDDVIITIIQPNVAHPDGMVRSWKTTYERLKEAQKEFILAARRTQDTKAPLVPDTKWCWFCPARSICPKQKELRGSKLLKAFKE